MVNVVIWRLLEELVTRLRHIADGGDRGTSRAEWLVVLAVLVALSAAVGWLVFNLLTGQGEPTTPPTVPERP